jgi:hypothetical protein
MSSLLRSAGDTAFCDSSISKVASPLGSDPGETFEELLAMMCETKHSGKIEQKGSSFLS